LGFHSPRARTFFEALLTDNLGMGRPDEISLIFDRRICPDTESGFMTKVVTRGVDTTVNFFYRHSRIKEYLKDGRALRIETVVNSTRDLGVAARLPNLPELITKARDANDRLLHAQRVGQSCVLANRAFERVALPTVDAAGKRGPRAGKPVSDGPVRPRQPGLRTHGAAHRGHRGCYPPTSRRGGRAVCFPGSDRLTTHPHGRRRAHRFGSSTG